MGRFGGFPPLVFRRGICFLNLRENRFRFLPRSCLYSQMRELGHQFQYFA
jgi:hypothetical protein